MWTHCSRIKRALPQQKLANNNNNNNNPNPIYSNCPVITVSSSTNDRDIHYQHNNYMATNYASAAAVVPYNDCNSLSMKSTTPQPDYFRDNGCMDANSMQSVQMRQQSPWSATYSAYPTMERSYTMNTTMSPYAQSLNGAELNNELEFEPENYNDFDGYELNRYASFDCSALPPPMENRIYGSAASSSSKSSGSTLQQIIFTVRLEPKGGLLGIRLEGSEDISKPITISGIVDGGIAHNNGLLQLGDQLLAIDNYCVQGIPLSQATGMLQNLGDFVDLKILRTQSVSNNVVVAGGNGDVDAYAATANMPQPQAIYAKVQRRTRSSSANTNASGSNTEQSNAETKHRLFHVVLFKDKVYDDYGFSVSDGLYERGVFINRIRTGGPADMCGMLKPFDRIMQVNEMKTQDFDCCLTVPLIAAAGDKIEMIIQRAE